jgi:hypothetical protein
MDRCEGPTKRTKHIDVKHHYLQQQVATNAFRLQQISTADKLADFLTKPLKRVLFQHACKLLHLTGLQTRGGVVHTNNNIEFVKSTSRCSAHEHRAHCRRHAPAYRLYLFASIVFSYHYIVTFSLVFLPVSRGDQVLVQQSQLKKHDVQCPNL